MTASLRIVVALLLIILALPARAAESAAVSSPRATATLISDTDRIDPAQGFKVALRLHMAPGWHTYWTSPGDAGVPPDLKFTLPDGASAGAVQWPAPRRQPEGPLMTYGYGGDLVLAVPVRGPAHHVALHASWLVCKEICVPEEGDFSLDLPSGPPAASRQAPLFAAAAAALPRPSPWTSRIAADGTLTTTGEGISPRSVRDAWFIPGSSTAIVNPAPQALHVRDGAFTLALKPGEGFHAGAPLSGLLEVSDAGGALTALQVAAEPGGPPAAPELPVWRVLGFAALGGLILNLMPCVFPVLAVKAVGLAGLSGAARRHALAHALSYTAGVVATFLLVGAAMVLLRSAGAAAGWGFQFQSPAFVAGITWVLLAVGLNLSGVFEVAPAGTGVGQRLTSRGDHAGSFFTGLLAVLVATPCTAPFMGVAIGTALATGSAGLTEAVFLAMGLGMAAPYVLLAGASGFARMLPRPGRWMEILRQALAFPMYAACAWLLWVMSQEAGSFGVVAVATGIVLVGFAAWTFGLTQRGDAEALGARGRRVARAAATAALLATLAVLSGIAATPPDQAARASEPGIEKFSADRLAALRAEGKPVFVNMTAAWCVTCLVNERVALAQPAVRAAFAADGITYLKGDWTLQDPAITRYLRSMGRDGVPLYVLYPPHGGAPVLLPQILTEGIVLAALDGMGG